MRRPTKTPKLRRPKKKHATKQEPQRYLVTYSPLAINKVGREAAETYNVPPFVDGSIRREPDLEHPRPGISGLCRGTRFAPRLRIGDIVGYLARPNKYGRNEKHRRLTALLRVDEVFDTHGLAADWYRCREMDLPNNCMVNGNPHTPLTRSHGIHVDSRRLSGGRLTRKWDSQYRLRSRRVGTYVICTPLFVDVSWDAPIVLEETLLKAFGRVPGTQNPGRLDRGEFKRFVRLLRVKVLV